MKKINFCTLFILILNAFGCSTLPVLPSTIAEGETSYSYIPFDPLPVVPSPGLNCTGNDTTDNYMSFLSSLPDQAVRLAVGKYDASGTLSFGPQTIGIENNSYQVILDYISVDATPIPIYIKRIIRSGPNAGEAVSIFDDSIDVATRYSVSSAPRESFSKDQSEDQELVVIPAYIGVGLRLTATVNVIEGRVNLSSLGALAAEAEAGKLSGSLVVQTLGITGNNVSKILPMPSELNQTTIQNAILSLGAIKAVLYDNENTIITPRVVGIYNPVGGGQQIVNGIISVLAEKPAVWDRPCIKQ